MRSRILLVSLLAVASALPGPHASAQIEPPQADELVPPLYEILTNPYLEPPTPYAASHRGVDLSAVPGTPVAAAASGLITFAGAIAGEYYVTLEVGGPRRVTYSYLGSIAVVQGMTVTVGDVIGATGAGHTKGDADEIHLGLRVPDPQVAGSWIYQDPMPPIRRYLRRVRAPVVTLVR